MSSPAQEQNPPGQGSEGRPVWHMPRTLAGWGVALFVGLSLIFLLLSILMAWHVRSGSAGAATAGQPLPVLFSLPEFSLIERSGENVTLATLADKVWIADFVFTTCLGPCPVMTKKMAGLQARLAGEPDVRLVTITVDPNRDTPEVLTEYANRFGADPKRWLFLTGDREAIFRLSKDGFRLATIVQADDVATTDHLILHSTKFILVDRQGRIRGYYDGTSDEQINQLEADARRLASDKPSGPA